MDNTDIAITKPDHNEQAAAIKNQKEILRARTKKDQENEKPACLISYRPKKT
jgi:hypothetical protein